MTTTRRIMWAGIALASFLWPLVFAAGVARANGIGDLYVGAGHKIVEVHLAGKSIVNTVDIPAGAASLAFSPDGRTLYAATGKADIAVVDIGTISAAPSLTAAGPAVAVAHPEGGRLAIAIPDHSRVALVNPADGATTDVGMTGPVDLLAADRRVSIVLAAATTGGWVTFIDASLGTSTTVAVDGRVVGMAVDRDTGGAYVATRSPNAVLRLDLGTHKVTWSAKLDAAPTKIAATSDGAVVAVGKRLLAVTAKGAATFATLPGAAVALSGSDDGKVLVAAMAGRVQGFAATGGAARSDVALAKGEVAAAIAPIPKAIVLDGGSGAATPTGRASGAAGNGTSTGAKSGAKSGTTAARPTHPPATSTDTVGLLSPAAPPIAGAVAVGVSILFAWWGIHLLRERRRRETLRQARVLARRSGVRPQRRRSRPPGSV